MNKYQKALDILHGFANGNLIRETTCDYQRDKNNEYKMILQELVDKATPKKPLDIQTSVVKWGICPVCKGKINEFRGKPNRILESSNYCPDCGQALDWSDEE